MLGRERVYYVYTTDESSINNNANGQIISFALKNGHSVKCNRFAWLCKQGSEMIINSIERQRQEFQVLHYFQIDSVMMKLCIILRYYIW